MKISYALLVAAAVSAALPATDVSALEVSANRPQNQGLAVGINARLNAANAAIEAVINQLLTCNNKGKIFVSDESNPDRDGDGCVSIDAGDSLQIADETINIPLDGCVSAMGVVKWASCTVSYDLTDALGNGYFQDMRVSGTGTPLPGHAPGPHNFTYDLGSLKHNVSTGQQLLKASVCSSDPFNAYITVDFNAATKVLTVTSERYGADSKTRCRDREAEISNLRVTGSKLVVKSAD